MSRGFVGYVKNRLREGAVARYTMQGKPRYIYRRDGRYYKLTDTAGSLYEASEGRVSEWALTRIVDLYEIEVVESPPEPVGVWQASGSLEALAAQWMVTARRRVGASEQAVREWIGLGHRLAEDVDERAEKRIRERVETLAESLN